MASIPEESFARRVRKGANLYVSRLWKKIQTQTPLAIARQIRAFGRRVTIFLKIVLNALTDISIRIDDKLNYQTMYRFVNKVAKYIFTLCK